MKEEINKNFDDWNKIKKQTESLNRPLVKKGEIYWCRIGLNIGTEQDGKNETYKRPVLIIKKFSKETILVVPLTTQKHSGDWYYNFLFNNLEQWAVLNQIKVIDTKRLEKKMGELSENKVQEVLKSYVELIQK